MPLKAEPSGCSFNRQWRWFWEFGGGIFTDLMFHQIDIAHWILNLDHPAEAMSIGDNFATKGLWETPDTAQRLLRYPQQELQVWDMELLAPELEELRGLDMDLKLTGCEAREIATPYGTLREEHPGHPIAEPGHNCRQFFISPSLRSSSSYS